MLPGSMTGGDGMGDYETIIYEERDGVAYVTLNRPEALNSFDSTMCREVKDVWRSLRANDDVRCAVLTGAGERAFCVGIDRNAPDTYVVFEKSTLYGTSNNYMYDDPGKDLGPKANDLWKPVVCAVNGMACGGAFYMIAEADIIIAAEHATFFDPHVTYGQAAVYEPIMLRQHISLGNTLRMALLGARERVSAQTALQIGLVTRWCRQPSWRRRRSGWVSPSPASTPSSRRAPCGRCGRPTIWGGSGRSRWRRPSWRPRSTRT